MKIFKIIPFRLKSSRFPNKALCTVFGKKLIELSLINTNKISLGKTILTSPKEDFEKIKKEINLSKYHFEYIPSSIDCSCATERILKIYNRLDGDYFISFPIDEASILPDEVEKTANFIINKNYELSTLYCDFFNKEDALSKLSAKIVVDNDGNILYMSRSVIPIKKNGDFYLDKLKKNVGIFFFKKSFLDSLNKKKSIQTNLDKIEGLEQLRWLELGYKLKTFKIKHFGFGIDIPDQINILEERIKCLQKQMKSE